jgi:hypothetical protein
MKRHFPLHFTLESGTNVQVSNAEGNIYHFSLTKTNGTSDDFNYVDDNRSRDEIENPLDFDQLNALRAFWLKREHLV